MLPARSAGGSIVATAPLTLTAAVVTSIVCTTELSLVCLITTLPEPFSTVSSNVITRFVPTATPVASSAGESVLTNGALVSAVTVSVKSCTCPLALLPHGVELPPMSGMCSRMRILLGPGAVPTGAVTVVVYSATAPTPDA